MCTELPTSTDGNKHVIQGFEGVEAVSTTWGEVDVPHDFNTLWEKLRCMTRTVNIEVYCDVGPDGGRDVFGVLTEHRPDFPDSFDTALQEWVKENFDHLEIGDSIEEAGEMTYKARKEVIDFEKSAE